MRYDSPPSQSRIKFFATLTLSFCLFLYTTPAIIAEAPLAPRFIHRAEASIQTTVHLHPQQATTRILNSSPKPESGPSPAYAFNCYLYVEHRLGVDLPPDEAMVPNAELGEGVIALMRYKDKHSGETVNHFAVVERVEGDEITISECNFRAGECGERTIENDDPHIIGYRAP